MSDLHCRICKYAALCLPEGREEFLKRWEVCDACGRFLLHVVVDISPNDTADLEHVSEERFWQSSDTLWYWDGPACAVDAALPHLYTGCYRCEGETPGLRVTIGDQIKLKGR